MLHDPLLLLFRLPGLLVGFVFHELAHAWVADALGDPSPRYSGRLTLNPLRHIEPVGFLLLLVAGFGWAKPVQVNPVRFRDPHRGMALVAAAGPLANLLLALVFLLALRWVPLGGPAGRELIYESALINVAMGVFNLLPVPPLDGSRVLAGLFPLRLAGIMFMETYGWIILMLLIVSGVGQWVLEPVTELVMNGLKGLAALASFR